MSDGAYLLAVVTATSLLAYLVGRRWGGLVPGTLSAAALRVLEWAGLAAGFYLLNVAVGLAAALLLRALGAFVSPYVTTDATLAVLSALQAVAYQWWRADGDRPGSGRPAPPAG